MTEWHCIPNYTMKCRLYPNKEQAKKIDAAIQAVKVYHNCILYDIFNNLVGTTEKAYKPSKKKKAAEDSGDGKENPNNVRRDDIEEGDPVHFIDTSLRIFTTAEYKNNLAQEHPVINCAPSGALLGLQGIKADISREFGFNDKTVPRNPIEFRKPQYYSNRKPRRSYTYQEAFSKISATDNRNVLHVYLCKVGTVKMRGWNKNIRFDESSICDFVEWATTNKRNRVVITVSKDNCGDYWICFKLSNVYKQMPNATNTDVGIDVGIKDLMITSNGDKYGNPKFKQTNAKHVKALSCRLSRRQGWSNISFRDAHKANPEIQPSRRYERTHLAHAKLERKIQWRRNSYNNRITYDVVANNKFIGVESLNVKGMFKNKNIARALSDAAIGEILNEIKYKGDWYGRTVQPIDQWIPSSKRCSSCKQYVYSNMTLNVREWTCPNCGAHHDRDINAARNILDYAKLSIPS